jgi:uncharacterized protein (PEP-CTERM system associated)
MVCARTTRPNFIVRCAFRQPNLGLTLAALAFAELWQPLARAQEVTRPSVPDLMPGLPDTGFGIPSLGGGGTTSLPGGGANLTGLSSPFAGVAGLPTTGTRGPSLYFQPQVGLSETLTDNVRYTATHRISDSITELSPGLSILADTPRTQGQLSFSFDYAKYAVASDLDRLSAALYSSSLTTVVPDTLFLDLRSSLSEASTNGGVGFTNVNQLPTSQLTQVFTNSVSPYYRKSFGDLADLEVRYNFSSATFSNGSLLKSTPATAAPISDSTSNEGTITISTGQDFQRLSSKLTLDAAKTQQGPFSSTSLSGFDDAQYQINEFFSANGRLGYQSISYPGASFANFSGATYLVGGQAQFGPRGSLTLQYGQQQGSSGLTGSGHYDITPNTTVTMSISQGTSTPQQQALGALATSALTPGGLLINQGTGLPASVFNPQFALQNSIYDFHSYTVGLTSNIKDNQFNLFASYDQRTSRGTASASSDSLAFNLGWSRSLNPDLTSSASLGYATVSNPGLGTVGGGPNTDSFNASFGLTYVIGYNLTGSLLYSFTYQTNPVAGITIATATSGDVMVNQLQLTITKAF